MWYNLQYGINRNKSRGQKKMKNAKIAVTLMGGILVLGAVRSQAEVDMDFFKQLVEIPSSVYDTPAVNRATQATRAYLEQHGVWCVVERHPDGKDVLYAATKPGKGHDYVISCHLDVVPPSAPGQCSVTWKDGKVWGRGVADCKSRCVAVIDALIRLNGKASVGCVFGADEENGGHTTRWMVEEKGYGARKMVIVTDSGWGKLIYAHKGQGIFRMRATGRGGHSALPWACDDSITRLTRAYLKIRELWDKRHPLAEDKWSDLLTPTIVRSVGEAYNRIPSEVEMYLNLRSVTPGAEKEVLELVREATDCEIETVRFSQPCISDPKHPLMQKLGATMSEVCGFNVPFDRMAGATDARWFVTCGVPIAMIGTDGGGQHGESEWANPKSFGMLAEILVRFISQNP